MAHWTRGLAVLALAGGVAAGGIALAQGPNMNLPIFGLTPGTSSPHYQAGKSRFGSSLFGWADPEQQAPARVRLRDDDGQRARRTTGYAFGYGKAICVRLCDGSFFPTGSVSGGEAACAAQCPDAPTALYTMPTDRIEDAVSSTGQRYTALPVAKRYQTSFEATCACRRDTVASRAQELLHDNTLRKGDVVMTASGFRVYQGDGYGPNAPDDFVALAKARNLSKTERATLTAMERANAGSPAPAAPALVAARPKGKVTVDSGEPAAAEPTRLAVQSKGKVTVDSGEPATKP
ncbi:MAG: DUF2865 domain-containing protein [Pseudomonadota bacterium]|nr:DUF2865 domain-containing protein [Pseudomonadota bacterium]